MDMDMDSSIVTLPLPLKMLYALNGATEGLPTLALTSLINDRISIPPSYLPAYYAIAFLPYSLKPLYAMLSNIITRTTLIKREGLMVVLLLASAVMIQMTVFLQSDQIWGCFVLAFAKGVFVSWAEFLVGVSLIATARTVVSLGHFGAGAGMDHIRQNSLLLTESEAEIGVDPDDSKTEADAETSLDKSLIKQKQEQLLSCYQSQAMTSRNIGSLLAHSITFGILLVRQIRAARDIENADAGSQMTDGVVNGMLLITSIMPIIASCVAFRYNVGRINGGDASRSDSSIRYSAPSCQRQAHSHNGNATTPRSKNQKDTSSASHLTSFHTTTKYDIISLLLFQALLMMIGLRSVIVAAMNENKAGWNVIFALMVVLLTASISYSHSNNHQVYKSTGLGYAVTSMTTDTSYEEPSTTPHANANNNNMKSSIDASSSLSFGFIQHLMYTKRVAAYLILRHAVPTPAGVLGSFTYTVFRTKPLFLQSISLMGSITAVLSSWTYGKKVAKTFSSLSGIKTVIIVSTVVCSFWSLLQVPFIHAFRERLVTTGGNGDVNSDNASVDMFNGDGMKLLIVLHTLLGLAGSFLGGFSFLPSVVLATNCIAYQSPYDIHTNPEDCELESCSNEGLNEEHFDEHHCQGAHSDHDCEKKNSWILDDGIQYGLLIACIDFGDQLSDFASIPIIEALNIRRDNDWKNLEWLIVICSFLGLLSLVFLRLLRP